MKRIHWILLLMLAAAVACLWLPPASRAPAWGALAALLLAIVVWGVVSMRSGIFGRAHTKAAGEGPWVSLTYDDGPDPDSTPALLELLRNRGKRAAFFVVGERARAHPELVRRCLDEGHLVENHSDAHSLLHNFLPRARMRAEVARCQETLAELAGAPPRFYRPPVGLMNHCTADVARDLGLELVGWQVRSLDTSRRRSPAAVARRVVGGVRAGGIILLHDGGLAAERVVEITRRILDGLEEKKLEPVRLDRLLGKD